MLPARSRLRPNETDAGAATIAESGFSDLVGESEAMQAAFRTAKSLTTWPCQALITGPAGSGKQALARAIHRYNSSSQRRFVAFDAKSAQVGDVEAHIFGRLRGGARRVGVLEYAAGGTAFVREVWALPKAVQAQLARALQIGSFHLQGSPARQPLMASVLAGSSQELAALAEAGQFSSELLQELGGARIHLPPLAERPGDIPLLVEHFTRAFERINPKELRRASAAALEALEAYAWPGNVRELEDAIVRACHAAPGPWIEVEHLPREVSTPLNAPKLRSNWEPLPLEEVRRDHIARVLTMCGGNRIRAARILGIGRTSLYRFLKRCAPGTDGAAGGED